MTHTERDPIEQNLHDRVIDDVVKFIKKSGRDCDTIRTNKGKSKDYGVKEKDGELYYPDVFTVKNKTVLEIYEVETSQSVNDGSVEQWKKFSSGDAKFYLVVPKSDIEKAEQIAKKNNIKVDEFFFF
ncbi:MAG: hypothetical protein ABH864_06725 [archaeon]